MKNDKKIETTLSDIIVKWESLSTSQKQAILDRVENSTDAVHSTEHLRLRSSFYLQTKSKL
ncbi:hypothetical protein [Bartonella sp. TT121SHDZB]|uniref:hypothetical protein n=1 Tax=Bartonella sp. TT121SHDZB TaxID=3243580 RepID=UPI0035CF481F